MLIAIIGFVAALSAVAFLAGVQLWILVALNSSIAIVIGAAMLVRAMLDDRAREVRALKQSFAVAYRDSQRVEQQKAA